MKDFPTLLRELAKSLHYQTIYSNEKEIGLQLFENKTDYSELQITFLNYLSFYYSINFDIAMGDIDKRVLSNFIYEDSYMAYKNKEKKEDLKETKDKKQEMKNKNIRQSEKMTKSQWVFRKPKASRV